MRTVSTPLQFAEHLNRAFTDALHLGAETEPVNDIETAAVSIY